MKQKNIYTNSIKAVIVVLTVLSTAILGFSAPSTGQYLDRAQIEKEAGKAFFLMRASLGNALSAGRIGGKRFQDGKAMKVYYQHRENQTFWVDDSGLQSRAEELLDTLENSWTHGLNPNKYHIKEIRALSEGHNPLRKAELELLMTDAFMRYAHDLTGMRVPPEHIKLNPDHWRTPMASYEILNFLSGEYSMDKALRAIEPQGATYKKLRKELIRLADEDAYDYERFLPVHFGGLMKPGWGHKGVIGLRSRMGLPQPKRSKGHYDDTLAAAVMKFQRENDLEPDGIIGDKTLQLLNRTKKDKMLQLIANMERLRWIEPNKPERFIVVNIPSATLWAIDHGRVKLEMPVIVGSPWRRTRVFKTQITGVRLNPKWTIPPTVKRFDILPKILEDGNYLADKGIELIKGYGSAAQTLDPSVIDWNNISPREINKIRFVQTPGEHNPLGRVRIRMPNDYSMFLHDTNHPEYFNKAERAVSSGCMRMKYPEKVANFVLSREKGWDGRVMDEVLETKIETDFDIAERIPVYILYYTAWVGNKGQVVFGTDVYNYDTKLIAELAKIDGYVIPRHNAGDSAENASYPRVRTH